MSLSAREEHILGTIEDGLARSDPRLARMLATFTRLAAGEQMPVREKIRAGLAAGLRSRQQPRRDAARRGARRRRQRPGLPQSAVLWLAVVLVTVVLVTVVLAVGLGGPGGRGSCTTGWQPAACATQVVAHPPGPAAHK